MRVIRPESRFDGDSPALDAASVARLVAAVVDLETNGVSVPDGAGGCYRYRGVSGLIFYTGDVDPGALASALEAGLAPAPTVAPTEAVVGGTAAATVVIAGERPHRVVEVWRGRVLPDATARVGTVCWRVLPAALLLDVGFTDFDRVNAVLNSVLFDAGEAVTLADDATVFDLRIADFRRVPVPDDLAVAAAAVAQWDLFCAAGRVAFVPRAARNTGISIGPRRGATNSWGELCAKTSAKWAEHGAVAIGWADLVARAGAPVRPACLACGVPFDSASVAAFAVVGGTAPKFACHHTPTSGPSYSPFAPGTPLAPIALCGFCAYESSTCFLNGSPSWGCLGGTLYFVRPPGSAAESAAAAHDPALAAAAPLLSAKYTPLCLGAYIGEDAAGRRFIIADAGLGRHAAVTHPGIARTGLPVLEDLRIAQ